MSGLLIWFFLTAGEKISQEQAIITAFSHSHAKILTLNISFKGFLKESEMDIDRLKRVVQDVARNFDINTSYTEQGKNVSDTYREYWLYTRTIHNEYLKIIARSEKQKDSDIFVNNIILELFQDNIYANLETVREKIQKVLTPYTSKLEASCSITGTYNGKLDKQELDDLSTSILKTSKAKKVHYLNKDDTVSVSAYSPLCDEFVLLKDKKVNMELLIRYNSYENKTYITLSSPKLIINQNSAQYK
jgi:hypothetical protein